MGPCAGGAVYSPAMTDFVIQVDGSSHMFITGPDVIKAVTGEEVAMEELGGAFTHASISGVTHFVFPNGSTALDAVRYMLSFFPQNNLEMPPYFPPTDSRDRLEDVLDTIIPDSPNQPYDMVTLIELVVDDGEFFQVHEHWARNLIVGFGRLDGQAVGIVANQPSHLAGTLDIEASEKGARFVRFCDSFNIPLDHLRRRARVPSRRRPGARRHHSPRRQAPLRLLRSDRAAGDGDHAQGLRRGLPRYECPRHSC